MVRVGKFGELGVAGKTLGRLVSAGFSISQLWDAAKTSPEVLQSIKDGDIPRAQYLLAKMGLTVGLAYLGAKHAATGKGAVTGKAPEVQAETHTLPVDEPIAQVLQEPVPAVRVTDSAAAKNHLVAAVAVLGEYSGSPAGFIVQSENMPRLAVSNEEFRLDLSWERTVEAKAERLRAT